MVETTDTRRKRTGRRAPRLRNTRVRAGAVVAVALLVAFVVWLVVRGDGTSTTPVPPSAAAVPITPAGLRTLSISTGIPIYWAGPKTGYTYELTKTNDNRVWVRYLPAGVPVGSRTAYLTVGTYPVTNAFAVTRTVSQRSGSVEVSIGNGGIAFYNESSPANVYFSYPDASYQVEVYDPSGSPQTLVSANSIVPVASATPAPASAAQAVTPAKLRSLAVERRRRIYWAGSEAGVTYELTETTGGSMYLRYLPTGVEAGVKEPYLTIGTYPLDDAFAVTDRQSRTAGSVRIDVGGGAVAFYNQDRPTNVYLAFRGIDQQIEVYDPSASRARGLVASGRITPVG